MKNMHALKRLQDARAAAGFSMVELLTVIAIIGVLATLLATALASGKRKGRQAYCTANLRQISLAFEMYFEDERRRPASFAPLVQSRNLPNPASLLCPEDKSGNWGELAMPERPGLGSVFLVVDQEGNPVPTEGPVPLKRSYFHPLGWQEPAWHQLQKRESLAGIAACQLHGLGRQNLSAPSILNFEGLVLRAQRDGAVVRRHIYWSQAGRSPEPPSDAPISVVPSSPTGFEFAAPVRWEFFTDEPLP
jgi:prepilin-type N-terminal cleavage/methylation domain-containing protein